MRKFSLLDGLVVPLDRANVDTDAIIPKQFLKSIKRSGFGPNAFDEWRYLDHGEPGMDNSKRSLNKDFVLNQPRYQGAQILLARENFGCGSSREHAPVALDIAGIEAVVAESYARIFYRNSIDGGFVAPFETNKHLYREIKTGDELVLDTSKGILTNSTQQVVYQLNPLGDIEGILRAGGIFSYARQSGMLKER